MSPEPRAAGAGAPVGEEASPVSLRDVRAAAERLRTVARRTPLLPVEAPAAGAGDDGGPGRAWLKCENLQHGGAFKLRGAYNFIAQLSSREREAGLITFSSGNHAQGVAFAAREFGIPAVIVMPEDAPRSKVEGTRALGGEVVREGTTSSERERRARELAAQEGYTVVPPFDHRNVIAGQGTVGLEIVEQLGEAAVDEGRDPEGGEAVPSLVLVPIGGGGLVSGVAAAIRGMVAGCRVVGVEPEGAASMARSLEAGEPVSLEEVETVADGLKPVRPGDLTFRHVRALVDDVVTVPDEEIRKAVAWCFRRKLVAEPSGAATVAALASGRVKATADGGATAAVVSGGNVDTDVLCRWLEAAGDGG